MSVNQIVIAGYGSVSALGQTPDEIRRAYLSGPPSYSVREVCGRTVPCFPISASGEESLDRLRSEKRYAAIDRANLMAILSARGAVQMAGWADTSVPTGVSIGSARGATGTLEREAQAFFDNGTLHRFTSPLTTLGSLSSLVANDLDLNGAAIGCSMTCTSALFSLSNGVAWLRSGMVKRFIAGGSEAPLTPFTFSQAMALKLHSYDATAVYPCRPISGSTVNENTMCLGEGSAAFALEALSEKTSQFPRLASIGFGNEVSTQSVAVTMDGSALERSMRMALDGLPQPVPIDVIILHSPGTRRGDDAELSAIKRVFPSSLPFLTSTKHRTGHTYGASGALSLEYALLLLDGLEPRPFPYEVRVKSMPAKSPRAILINSAGFGGNAVSIVVTVP